MQTILVILIEIHTGHIVLKRKKSILKYKICIYKYVTQAKLTSDITKRTNKRVKLYKKYLSN